MRVIYFLIIILLFKPLNSAENELGTVLVSPNNNQYYKILHNLICHRLIMKK